MQIENNIVQFLLSVCLLHEIKQKKIDMLRVTVKICYQGQMGITKNQFLKRRVRKMKSKEEIKKMNKNVEAYHKY